MLSRPKNPPANTLRPAGSLGLPRQLKFSKDPAGRNVFAGGFLGLDNIGVVDRSAQLPTGGSLEQADGTAWMAFYCQNMMEIALIFTEYDPMYEKIAYKFAGHFLWISSAMDRLGEQQGE